MIQSATKRIISLDIFRGITIFLMIVVNTPGSWSYVYAPLLHAKWDGCTPTDVVFPFFMWIVGYSMFISSHKYLPDQRWDWIKKSINRGIKIILIGLLLNYFPFFNKSLDTLRLFGVLPRIGLSFMVGSILVSYLKPHHLLYFIISMLLLYWFILLSFGDMGFTLEGNPVRLLDVWIVGENHIYKGYGIPFDPEGLLSTLPSICTVLLGYYVAYSISSISAINLKINYLFKIGILLSIAGIVWHFSGFRINKPLWSSSYVFFTSGCAALSLAVLMYIIDLNRLMKWSYIFRAFGQNPLISYALSGLLIKSLMLVKIDGISSNAWIFQHVFMPIHPYF